MRNSRLIRYLRKLDAGELRQLEKFVQSPFFNQREEVLSLLQVLATGLRREARSGLPYEIVYANVFPDQPFDAARLRHCMSYLLSLVRQFMVINELQSDDRSQDLYRLRALQRHRLDDDFDKERRRINKQWNRADRHDAIAHLQRYQLEQEHYDNITRQRRTEDMDMRLLGRELTIFFLADLLRQQCNLLTHEIAGQQSYENPLLAAVLVTVESGQYQDQIAVMIYYHAYRALTESEAESHFLQLRQLITEHYQNFPAAEMRYIYLLAINYCIKRVNRGDREYLREALDLYTSGLENRVLLEQEALSHMTYHNVLRLGLALRRYDWAETFLKTYQSYLPAPVRENTYRYNLAFLHFEQKDYERAMHYLRLVDFPDVFSSLDARRLLLRSYYELGEYKALDSLLDSSRVYIQRRRDIGYHKINYLNLIRFTKKLLNVAPDDRPQKDRLRKEIEQTPNVAERQWLIEKLSGGRNTTDRSMCGSD